MKPLHTPPALALDRRSLLWLGSVSAAWPTAAAALSPRAPATVPTGTYRYVVMDRRHTDSLAFAGALVRRGSTPLDVVEGLTALWQDHLAPLWRQPDGGPIAGLTSEAVWHCLAEQARSHARRAVVLQRHDTTAPSLVSWVIA